MQMNPITWYSLDQNLATIDHGAVDEEAALRVVEVYVSQLLPYYDTGEQALAGTLFGFEKSKTDFVEICLVGPGQFSLTYEVTYPARLLVFKFSRVFRKERTLGSVAEVRKEISAYYRMDAAAFRERFR